MAYGISGFSSGGCDSSGSGGSGGGVGVSDDDSVEGSSEDSRSRGGSCVTVPW